MILKNDIFLLLLYTQTKIQILQQIKQLSILL